ncbi:MULTISPECIES: hypothetical protein [Novosphingobium]|uniref:ABC transporter permease n=1 Tax=Novosphingobium panipatense TaxID=428991 RepID=A0ABY1Q2E3_9SPHN|nr:MULTISPECIES: hypothetical protein [Novosphingobium]SMP53881.1 hypothetical protein SAMN06296065_101484 [Novosphingobium panipatense]
MRKGGWQRSLIDATVLWMAVFPAIKVLADLVRARSVDLSGAGYFWAFAFRGSWTDIGISLAYLAIYVGLTAAVLRYSGKTLFS